MEQIPYSHIEKGSLLIASPEIDEGMYFRSVVLICEHSPSGSLGLIINKPLEMELPEEILDLDEIANHKIELSSGGPIQPSQMLLLHSSDQIPSDTLKVADKIYLGGDLQFLREASQDANGPAIRLCFGYGAWGPGQLEHEFLNGEWFLHPANPTLVFETPSAKMWQTVLREMGGKYAALSMMPEDLSLN